MTRLLGAAALALLPGALGCAASDTAPADLDVRNEICRSCRMPVSEPKLAAQLAAPGQEHLFFDDIGCLRDFLVKAGTPRAGAVAYVADHRTGRWTRASGAVFSRCPAVETPMGFHLVAHADSASRASDPSASGCTDVAAADILGSSGPPGSKIGG